MTHTELKRRADLNNLTDRQREAARLVCVAGVPANTAGKMLGMGGTAVRFAVAKLQRPLASESKQGGATNFGETPGVQIDQ
jgi:DNA-directed RNA polymerase specialized sigma24 family protein